MSWEAGRVRQALRGVIDARSGKNIVDSGFVRELTVEAGHVRLVLDIDPERHEDPESLRAAAEAAARAIPGMISSTATLNPDRRGESIVGAPARPASAPAAKVGASQAGRPQFPSIRPAGVGKIIAVASGKGGVGKSTVAVNIACAMARLGKQVGILDADVYGPSTPTMLGLSNAMAEVGPNEKIAPLRAHGVKAMSMGFVVRPGAAMAWRGPMVMNALVQLFVSVDWGDLDVLILDLPPGTGDVQLTLAQQVAVDGAVIVSTPQEVALADVRRGAEMFGKTGIPVLGVVENMSFYADPVTGMTLDLFGRGGARKAAEELGMAFLGEIPIEPALRAGCDEGQPLAPGTETVFLDLARSVLRAAGVA